MKIEPVMWLDRTVTEDAMRPASDARECFYCHQPIGGQHGPKCVLIRKKAKVRMIAEYEIDIPAHWDKNQFEFSRNDGTWCADNALQELDKARGASGCLCDKVKFEHIADSSEPFLGEK